MNATAADPLVDVLSRLSGLPDTLTEEHRWCLWRFETTKGKKTKVPINAATGERAKSNDPQTWADYASAIDAFSAGGSDGIGFFLGAGFAGLDLDHALDATGELKAWARPLAEKVRSYTEVSPSGRGVKIIARANGTGGTRKTREGGEPGEATELYYTGRFFTVTGLHFPNHPSTVEDADQPMREIFADLKAGRKKKSAPQPIVSSRASSTVFSDDEIIDRASNARKNGDAFARLWSGHTSGNNGDASSADLALCNHLAFWTGGNREQMDRLFRGSALMREKWNERHSSDGRTYGQMTLDKAIAGTTAFHRPRRESSPPAPPTIRKPTSATVAEVKSSNASRCFDANHVSDPEPLRLAEHFIDARWRDSQRRLTLRRYGRAWWMHSPEQGRYHEAVDESMHAMLYRHLDQLTTNASNGERKKIKPNSSMVREVDRAMPACGLLTGGAMPAWLDGRANPLPRDVIAFQNGLLDVGAFRAGEPGLMPPTPLWFSASACPFPFDPNAKCPTLLNTLDDIFPGDAESIALIQEWFGLQLVPDNSYEKIMMLVGPTRAGKGVTLEALSAMLGDDQVAVTSFQKLSLRFGLAPLVGKLAAILPDAHIGRSTDDKAALEALKSISGGDEQAVDRKNVDELARVRLSVRFTIAVNELPELPDTAGTIKPRLLLLHYRQTFAGREDTGLKARIRTEAPGIARWAIEGLCRLREQGFTVPSRSQEMIEEFERTVSPVKSFLHERCEIVAGDWIPKDDLYAAWEAWCKDRGDKSGNVVQFARQLVSAAPTVKAGRRGPRGQQFTTYEGIRLCQ